MDALLSAYSDDDETTEDTSTESRVILHNNQEETPSEDYIGPSLPSNYKRASTTETHDADYIPPLDSSSFQNKTPTTKPVMKLEENEFVVLAKKQKITHIPVQLDESLLPSIDGKEVIEKVDTRDKRYISKKEKELDQEEPLNGPNSISMFLILQNFIQIIEPI
jgi:hypothetical protein